ncbi:TPA: hypothetical protein ACPJ0E_002002 [Vibrio diabolicus]|uniref:hypothetical protein n=1 Tax=Vibrio sp. HS-50-1 TaxID=2945079 RepID=UPI00215FE314|nr:hypothetical protein [Vibrio sp. HS-50-1]
MDQESFHSLLFRISEIYSLSNEQCGLIGKNGRWHKYPSWPECKLSLLGHLSAQELLNTIDNSDLISSLSLFDSPKTISIELQELWGSNSPGKKGDIPIRYCEECIKKSIVENGFAYLHSSWLYSSICETHHTNLRKVVDTSRGNAIKQLRLVFAGKFSAIASQREWCIPTNHKPRNRNFLGKYGVVGPLMPCIKREFRIWIHNYAKPFQRSAPSGNSGFSLNFLYSESGFFLPMDWDDECWEFAFQQVSIYHSNHLDNFLNEKAFFTKIPVRLIPEKTVNIDVIKLKSKDCMRCTLYQYSSKYCDKSLVIAHTRLHSKEYNYCVDGTDNYCDFVLVQSKRPRKYRQRFFWS